MKSLGRVFQVDTLLEVTEPLAQDGFQAYGPTTFVELPEASRAFRAAYEQFRATRKKEEKTTTDR
jgi:hypothetical protein